ncbi:MAG: serine acetyltransferase [Bacteroidales bacterium]|nr:serine acetyltransferase [Bacteroidales bacterium]
MSKDIIIFGAGGFGREVASMIKRINANTPTWTLLGFVDDDSVHHPIGSRNEYGEILGDSNYLNSLKVPTCVTIAISNPHSVKKIVEKLSNPLLEFPNLIAADAAILDKDNFNMGYGNILCSFVSMSCHVKLGNFNVFNNRCSVGHDAVIGDFNAFMTATRISGGTTIGTLNSFGANSVLLQGLTVGENTTIGAGSVVMRKTKNGFTYIGNPAKQLFF